MFPDSPPDAELFAAAAAKKLSAQAELKPHVDHLFAKSEVRVKIHRFFDSWLRLKRLNHSGFAEDFAAGVNVAKATDEGICEMIEFIDYVVFTTNGTLTDLIASRATFPRKDAAAQILGAPKLGVEDKEPAQTKKELLGLLMRPTVLATDGNENHSKN